MKDVSTKRTRHLVLIAAAGCISTACASMGPPQEIEALRAKALAGDVDSQVLLARAYDTGRGVKPDMAQAARWYEAAATQGNSEAQNDIGSLYLSGEGVNRDPPKACDWFARSSAQNNIHGKGNLAFCYDEGVGVDKDLARAAALYAETAQAGNVQSMLNLGVDYWRGYGVQKDLIQGYMWLDLARSYSQNGAANRQLRWRVRGALDDISKEMSSQEISQGEMLARAWDKKNSAKVTIPLKY